MKNLKWAAIAFTYFLGMQVQAEDQIELRFTCEETQGIGNKGDRVLIRLMEIVSLLRGLSIQAATGTMGFNGRLDLQIQYSVLLEEIQSLMNHSSFTDSYNITYDFFKDGLRFESLNYSHLDQLSIPVNFKLAPLPLKTLGSLAESTFQVVRVNHGEVLPSDYLLIQGIAIPAPLLSDDSVSFEAANNSAIAIAREINAKAGRTQVIADVLETTTQLSKIDFSKVNNFGGTDFTLNGINITGVVVSIPGLIDLLNTYSAQSGVRGRSILDPNNTQVDGIELYAPDGRNIDLKVKDELLPAFGGQLISGSNVFIGKIRLRSPLPIEIVADKFPILGFQGKQNLPISSANILATSVETQITAQNALTQLDAAYTQIARSRAQFQPLVAVECAPHN